jgi:hypothetical protein
MKEWWPRKFLKMSRKVEVGRLSLRYLDDEENDLRELKVDTLKKANERKEWPSAVKDAKVL